ncbi:MAG: 4Fe-4S dicluster domain-containing protein [Phycisphaerae bacterium]
MTTGSVTSTDKDQEAAKAPKKARGIVSIDSERCKGCEFCVEFCPLHVLAMSAKFNSKGYHYPEVVAAEKCAACDLCGMYCPDFAIYASRVPDPDSTKE